MIDARHDRPLDTEDARVLDWRAACLLSAGFDTEAAFTIAADTRIDLHEAIGLVESGCPPAVAARIVL